MNAHNFGKDIKDMPDLYISGNNLSIKSQTQYLLLSKIDLFAMILSAGLSVLVFMGEGFKNFLIIIVCCLLVLSIILRSTIRHLQLEKYWYHGRAIAESVKTLTWRYVTRVDPFTASRSQSEVDSFFLQNLHSISNSAKTISPQLEAHRQNDSSQITPAMKTVRSMAFEDRKKIYLQHRITDQCSWYQEKAKYNARQERNWFIYITVAQVMAILFAILMVRYSQSPVNVTAFLVTISSAATAWIKLKQFQELSQSYSVAGQELSFIREKGNHINNEEEFVNYASDAENAVSREHTLWIARRDHLR
jgi:hypothetical protein